MPRLLAAEIRPRVASERVEPATRLPTPPVPVADRATRVNRALPSRWPSPVRPPSSVSSVDEHATSDELDPPAWGPPEYDSYLVRTCHELRKKPLSQFTIED